MQNVGAVLKATAAAPPAAAPEVSLQQRPQVSLSCDDDASTATSTICNDDPTEKLQPPRYRESSVERVLMAGSSSPTDHEQCAVELTPIVESSSQKMMKPSQPRPKTIVEKKESSAVKENMMKQSPRPKSLTAFGRDGIVPDSLRRGLSTALAGVIDVQESSGSASTAERYALYAEQLKETPVSSEVIATIAKIHNIRTYFYWRRFVEDGQVLVAIIGIALMVATNEVTEQTRHDDSHSGACNWDDCDVRDNVAAIWLKALMSVSTLVLLALTTARYAIETRLKVLRGFYTARTSCFFLHFKEASRWFIECCACAFHIPPGVDFTWLSARTAASATSARVHANVLGVFMLIRLYLLLRFLRNHNGTYSPHSSFLGSLHGVRVNDSKYAIKYMFRQFPIQWISFLAILLTAVTTIALTIVERPGATEGVGVDTYLNGLWLTVITMSTVGYGDLGPESHPGRFILFLGGVLGGALITTMLTGVFISFVSMNDREERVTVLFARQAWEQRMRSTAATMLQRAFRLKLAHRKGTKYAKSAFAMFRLESLQINAQNAIRSLRRQEPASIAERSAIDKMGEKIDTLIDYSSAILIKQGGDASKFGRRVHNKSELQLAMMASLRASSSPEGRAGFGRY